MNESLLLRDAAVQDSQMELLRRTSFNALDGERVCASLRKHRQLWHAALLDRPGVPNCAAPGQLLISGPIKLRDLPDNFWTPDRLFLLTPTHAAATPLAPDRRGGEVRICKEQAESDRALGTGCAGSGLMSVWWD